MMTSHLMPVWRTMSADHGVAPSRPDAFAVRSSTESHPTEKTLPWMAPGSRLSLLLAAFALAAAPAVAAERQDVASQQARPAPEYLTRGVIYQVWLRTFTPEGTLKAATARLADVADLGATIVYLSPIQLQDDDPRPEYWSPRQQKSPNADPRNPYRVKDYDRIDPEYGTEADLKEFVNTAHKLGLKVLMDIVYHHTGPTCVLLEKPGYYQLDAEGKPKLNQWNFLRLNLENPELREYLTANMLHWVRDCGVDGFRCDVSGAVPLDFWEPARERLDKVRPDVVVLAEGIRAADQVKAFDVSYSFSWYTLLKVVVSQGRSATVLQKLWETRHGTFPRGARFIRYIDNHDIYRSTTLFGEGGARAASVLNFTIDGVPYLYNGQEIGDATPQDLYHHWPINWEAGGLPRGKASRAFFQKLCQMRRQEAALTDGDVVWLKHDQPDSVVALLRRTDQEEILSVVNLSNRPLEVRLNLPQPTTATYRNLLAEDQATATSEGLSLKLGCFAYFVGKRK